MYFLFRVWRLIFNSCWDVYMDMDGFYFVRCASKINCHGVNKKIAPSRQAAGISITALIPITSADFSFDFQINPVKRRFAHYGSLAYPQGFG